MGITTHWKVRPYVLTGGRARTRNPLLIHTLVSVPHYDVAFAGSLEHEMRAIYERARLTCSIAELSAECRLPLGVARVVVDDLAAVDRIMIHPDARATTPNNLDVLERLRDGLRKLA